MSILALVLGLVLAAVGGDRFVRGTVGLAARLGVPAGIIGATVAAFATSSPELTVGVIAALDGRPELAFGDATGSNMVNLGVVLGSTLLVGSVAVHWADVRREVTTFLLALAVVAVVGWDGRIDRIGSVALLVLFVGWVLAVVRAALADRVVANGPDRPADRQVLVDVVGGLVALVVAGRLIVIGGKAIGEALGWDQFIVGTVIVAIGTSAPELVTTLVAVRRGHVGVGVGTVLGSNIFNSAFIVGIAGSVSPIGVDRGPASAAIVASVVACLSVVPGSRPRLGRARGAMLVATYVCFLAAVFTFG